MRIAYLLVVVALMTAFGCSGGSSGTGKTATEKALVSIQIQPTNNRLAIGTSLQFSAVGTYADNSTQDVTASAVWSSSDTAVATIAANGKATAVAAGTTTITAKVASTSGSTVLTVPVTKLDSIKIEPAQVTIAAGTTTQLTAKGQYTDNTNQKLTNATWSSSATSVATVATDGTVTGLAPGQATITASMDGVPVPGTATVTVTSATLRSLSITPLNATLASGISQQFVANGTFSDDSRQDMSASVAWSSSNPSVAAITSTGIVTAAAAGTTTITAVSPRDASITASTPLTVTTAVLQSIAIAPANPSASAGTTRQFVVTGLFSDGSNHVLSDSVAWTSSDSSVATIAPDGNATAVAPGTATISATYGDKSSSTAFTVTPADFSGTWVGTYTIYEDANNSVEVGKTYTMQWVLSQSGTSLSGVTTLRDGSPERSVGTLTGTVTGQTVRFNFKYYSPYYMTDEEDIGSGTVTGGTMTGTAIENHTNGWSLNYRFELTKQP
ncbi:Ig-like domain-containing protein [Geobacter sp. SVR]|uniref:Ig-like domain-containing protein n=1 Tax=Geobacter sp. SVR TaxID=2495594 RepID=UPI00143EF7BE|nr:Ig-like domain-containing protein [Geobacter sp. SVR]BCS53429.1 hypothetical protein GSVR_17370 [Geobacter sp. SVR]GCF85445.1 hypothetical protein GSbR_20450 [Geobacter sp. SVR]